jgi:alpha-N-acetylglucosamine transferase
MNQIKCHFLFFSILCTLRAFQYSSPQVSVVTLFIMDEPPYINALQLLCHSLRSVGFKNDITLMLIDNPTSKLTQIVEAYSLKVVKVSPIVGSSQRPRYRRAFTKFRTWSLMRYQQIIYVDVDFVFLKDPSSALADCGQNKLCACPDSGMPGGRGQLPDAFTPLNSGFMVIRPNPTVVDELIKALDEFQQQQPHLLRTIPDFSDQQIINYLFGFMNWTRLDSKYNRLHCATRGLDLPHTVGIHEKYWTLRRHFPETYFPWNNFTFIAPWALT